MVYWVQKLSELFVRRVRRIKRDQIAVRVQVALVSLLALWGLSLAQTLHEPLAMGFVILIPLVFLFNLGVRRARTLAVSTSILAVLYSWVAVFLSGVPLPLVCGVLTLFLCFSLTLQRATQLSVLHFLGVTGLLYWTMPELWNFQNGQEFLITLFLGIPLEIAVSVLFARLILSHNQGYLLKLNQAYDELASDQQEKYRQQTISHIGQMAGEVAHHINNPLAIIRSGTQILHSQPMSDGAQASLDKIDRSAERIHHTIEALVQLARPPEAMIKNLFYLSEVVIEVKNHCQSLADKKQVTLVWKISETARINGHFAACSQILIALIKNGVDAAAENHPDGGGIVIVNGEYIENSTILVVEDNGPGIPANLSKKIYEPFFTTKPAGHGQGLGLAISVRFAKVMDAILDHYSTSAGQNCFRVQFAKVQSKRSTQTKSA